MKINEEKPLILKMKEVEQNIAKTINEAGLPAFLLVKILEGYYNELQSLANKEAEIALKKYSESSQKEK